MSVPQAIERRRRLMNPVNAVPDRPITMRNGRPINTSVVSLVAQTEQKANKADVIPKIGDTHETVLAPGRHLGTAILRGQRARILPIDAPRGISVALILAIVAERYAVSVNDILSMRRTQAICLPRQIVAYIARHMTRITLPALGRRLGNRDHTTILSAVRKVARKMEGDQEFTRVIADLQQRVLEAAEG